MLPFPEDAIIIGKLREAIRNINRNLYEWLKREQDRNKIGIEFKDINGLVKNWILRYLKTSYNISDLTRTLPTYSIHIELNKDQKQLKKLSLYAVDTYSPAN